MTQTILAVSYRLTDAARQDDGRTLKQQFAVAAPFIAATPGLSWKISAIDTDRSVGLGIYLFETDATARDFADGALIGRLRQNPGIANLRITRAPVLRDLSLAMRAGQAIGIAPQIDDVAASAMPAAASQ